MKNLNPLYYLEEQVSSNTKKQMYVSENFSRKKLLQFLKQNGHIKLYKQLKGGLFKQGATDKEIINAIKKINQQKRISNIRNLMRDLEPVNIDMSDLNSSDYDTYLKKARDIVTDTMKKRHPRSYFNQVVDKNYRNVPIIDARNIGYIYPKNGGIATHGVFMPEITYDLKGMRKHGFEFASNVKDKASFNPLLDLSKLGDGLDTIRKHKIEKYR